jgi:hypothetical protein
VKRAAVAALAVALLLPAGGCAIRLSDPVYVFKDIRADEPSHDGTSLLMGTIVVEQWMSGDLNSVSLVKLGPGKDRTYYGANRVNLFRAFSPRTMKDGNFIIEVDPGVYELENFSTSGWGQPRTWNARADARKNTRIIVTRPGVYDIGTVRIQHEGTLGNTYSMERGPDASPDRHEVFMRAIAGTRWEKLAGGAGPAGDAAVKEQP